MTREMFEAFAVDDEVRASYEEFETRQAEREQAQARTQVVKTFEQPVQRQQSTTTMTPSQEKDWNTWCRAMIAQALHDEPFTQTQMDIIARFVSDYVHERITALKTEIGSVRGDSVTPIKGKASNAA